MVKMHDQNQYFNCSDNFLQLRKKQLAQIVTHCSLWYMASRLTICSSDQLLPLKLGSLGPGWYLDGRPARKADEVLMWPTGHSTKWSVWGPMPKCIELQAYCHIQIKTEHHYL